jgi:hypothetical protein
VFRGTWYLAAPAFAAIVVLVGRDANHGQKLVGRDANHGQKYKDNWLAGMPTMDKLVGRDANRGQIGWQGCQPRK